MIGLALLCTWLIAGLICAIGQARTQISEWGRVRLWDWVAFAFFLSPGLWLGLLYSDFCTWVRIHFQSRGYPRDL